MNKLVVDLLQQKGLVILIYKQQPLPMPTLATTFGPISNIERGQTLKHAPFCMKNLTDKSSRYARKYVESAGLSYLCNDKNTETMNLEGAE
jgi:hypothetical protein